jgi:hypothetical protein
MFSLIAQGARRSLSRDRHDGAMRFRFKPLLARAASWGKRIARERLLSIALALLVGALVVRAGLSVSQVTGTAFHAGVVVFWILLGAASLLASLSGTVTAALIRGLGASARRFGRGRSERRRRLPVARRRLRTTGLWILRFLGTTLLFASLATAIRWLAGAPELSFIDVFTPAVVGLVLIAIGERIADISVFLDKPLAHFCFPLVFLATAFIVRFQTPDWSRGTEVLLLVEWAAAPTAIAVMAMWFAIAEPHPERPAFALALAPVSATLGACLLLPRLPPDPRVHSLVAQVIPAVLVLLLVDQWTQRTARGATRVLFAAMVGTHFWVLTGLFIGEAWALHGAAASGAWTTAPEEVALLAAALLLLSGLALRLTEDGRSLRAHIPIIPQTPWTAHRAKNSVPDVTPPPEAPEA